MKNLFDHVIPSVGFCLGVCAGCAGGGEALDQATPDPVSVDTPVLPADAADGGANGDGGADSHAPLKEAGGPSPENVVSGGRHTCVRLDDGRLKCWGLNGSGQLGLDDKNNRGDDPGEMGMGLPGIFVGIHRFAFEIAGGSAHTCVRLDNGQVKCWGNNSAGELGLGDTVSRGGSVGEMASTVSALDFGPGRIALQVRSGPGGSFSCVLLDDDTIKCWGRNELGQLGLEDTKDRGGKPGEMGANLPAVDLGPGHTPVELRVGGAHACARLDNGQVKCWGYNIYGQLGLGDTNGRGDYSGEMGASLPVVDLGPGRTAVALALGNEHSCAILDDGHVKCWGANIFGKLGLGDANPRGDGAGEMGASLPVVDLGPGRTAVDIRAGSIHTCAILDNGQVKCWGGNIFGQLGVGDLEARGDGPGEMGANLPAVDLGPGRTAVGLTLGIFHTCARLDNAQLKCWGANGNGEQGSGDKTQRGGNAIEMGANLPAVDYGGP